MKSFREEEEDEEEEEKYGVTADHDEFRLDEFDLAGLPTLSLVWVHLSVSYSNLISLELCTCTLVDISPPHGYSLFFLLLALSFPSLFMFSM